MNKNLKPVPADKKKSLGKLPTDVRNKMGYAKKGKMVKDEKPKEKPKKPGQIFIELKTPMKAKEGKMMTFKEYVRDKRENAQIGPTEEKNLKRKYIKMIRGKQVGPAEEAKLMGNMKSKGGEMKQGYGAARTSGMGLQDEDLIPGKSMDYYKDLM